MIQAAGDNGAVAENAQLIPQTVAEDFFTAFRGIQIRPIKLVDVFQIGAVGNSCSKSFFNAILREMLMHGLENALVLLVFSAVVPKPVDYQLFAGGCLAEGKTICQVLAEGNG